MSLHPFSAAALVLASLLVAWPRTDLTVHAQVTDDIDLSRALRWRPIGPAIGGAVTAAAGVVSTPGAFFAAVAGAGIWSTPDYGASWQAVFDAPPFGDVSALAVARDGRTLYAAVDEIGARPSHRHSALMATTDAGATWARVPVDVPGRITVVVADPTAPARLLFAIDGADDASAGIYRSLDGGRTVARVLDAPGAVVTLVFAADAAFVVFPRSGIAAPRVMRSTDAGATWQAAEDGLARVGDADEAMSLAAVPDGGALLVATRAGTAALYRFDATAGRWTVVNDNIGSGIGDARVSAGAGGAVYIMGEHAMVSHDAGTTFTAAPVPIPRDHAISWAHPGQPGVLVLGGPAGVTISVNDGRTWSDPAALPAATVAHVTADAAYPYRICAVAAAKVGCRSSHPRAGVGQWDWLPLDGPVVPDPQEADVLFDARLGRYDRRTTQAIDVAWADRAAGGPPFVLGFSADGRLLYAAGTSVARTTNDGTTWTDVGLDLASRDRPASRATAVAVSPIDPRTVWVAFDDGRLFVTRDAAVSWGTATAHEGRVAHLEPSHFDSRSAYVVVEDDEAGSRRLLRTRDEGLTWVDIGAAMPRGTQVNAVREDALRRGLLYAGTDSSLFVSYDDGDRWWPLQLNLPATPVRDVFVKEADLIVATAGRGVWVLEDLTPLRQITPDVARADVFLFQPAPAWRTRASALDAQGGDDRASLTYSLGAAADEVRIDIVETATGELIRRFSSDAEAETDRLAVTQGIHRIAWDLRYTSAVAGAAPGTRVLPGVYQVRLATGNRVVRQALPVRLDPRVRTSIVDLTAQRDLGRAIDAARAGLSAQVRALPPGVADAEDARARLAAELAELDQLARQLQQADVRPSPAIEAAVEAAVARAAATAAAPNR